MTTWPPLFEELYTAGKEAWQLQALPYSSSSALAVGVQLLLFVIFVCWFASIVTRNYSHTDRLWSIVPFVYVWHFAYRAYIDDGHQWNPRLVVMAVLATLWGLRLTFNFWRKGGYSLSEEDYRWAVLRKKMHWIFYQLFNIAFIAGYQNILLFLMILPAYEAYKYRVNATMTTLDWVAMVLFLLLLTMETVADQQQWDFYVKKYELIAKKQPLTGDYKAGFNRSGLFRYSRHPNFFAEFSQWCVFYLFSVSSSGEIVNASCIGAVLLVLLFQGSTVFTESITVSKYSEYKTYQQNVSALIPWFPKRVVKADKQE